MTTAALILAAVTLAAVLRRLTRTAVVLLLAAVVLGAGPTVISSLEDLGDERSDGSDATQPRAVDGDTFSVDRRAGSGRLNVRVALIDAGEASSARFGHPTCGGGQAKRFASRWAARHRSVRLRPVAGLPREDRYDRRLARIAGRDGHDYGIAVVRRGWARVVVYEQPRGTGAAYLARLRSLEAAARAARRGGWGTCGWGR